MREIRKSRVWDGERMITSSDCHEWGVSLVLTLGGELLDICCERCDLEGPVNDKYVHMFSTGLKDKNGVEIYEGDIVTYTACLERYPFGKWSEEKTTVKYKIHDHDMHGQRAYWYPFVISNGCRTTNVEVIGNVYEGVKNDPT